MQRVRLTDLIRIGAVGVLLGSGCAREAKAPAAEIRKAGAPLPVRTALVIAARGIEERLVPATVHARERAVLSARGAASVAELPRREGDFVSKGDLLVRLDDAALRSGLAAAELSRQAAERDLRRAQSLVQKGAATPRELDEADARAGAARAAVEAARDQLAHAVLRAPFAGRIVARPANLGDVTVPGRPLLELESAAGLELRATLDAELFASVHPGSTLRAFVDGQPQPLSATVRVVVPSADPATHRFEIRAELPGAPGLHAGLFARLALPLAASEERLLVPTAALLQRGGLVGAFVVAEGRARLRFIATGRREGDDTEVRAGLEAGERVALEPASLRDGAFVEAK
jgi:RND family efflux transporter MFP subunit